MMTELFAEIVGWAVRNGAESIDMLERPWEGETDEWRVRINATGAEFDKIPHMSALLEHRSFMRLGIVSPKGGHVIGVTEGDLINHFKVAP